MGRELRMVPQDWEHPKNEQGHDDPLHGRSYKKAFKDYKKAYDQWQKGFREGWDDDKWEKKEGDELTMTYKEWAGDRPFKVDYMPEWEEEEKTHFQMYETCTEGTPISPVMETPEKLAQWLTDNEASAFASMTASYDSWLSTIKAGSAPSAIMIGGKLLPGTELNKTT